MMSRSAEKIWVTLMALVILTAAPFSEAAHHRFGYTKPEQRRWARAHQSCAGRHQSPIAISNNRAIPLNMPAIELVGYNNLLPGPITLHNNGHSVSLDIPKSERGTHPYIFGGKMLNEYELEGLHFHWGDKNNRGSEHVLNDIRYPLEMHIIHRNKKYKTVAEALGYSDGLTVLGFLYQVTEHESPEIAHLLRSFPMIEEFNNQVQLNFTFTLNSILGDLDLTRFYTYKGSLTTPPCSEAVTWVLFPDLLSISIMQIRRFRMLDTSLQGVPMVDNFRALQPVGNRRIFVRKVNSRNTALSELTSDIDYTRWEWVH
ncbi:carbonic anhydrase 7 [Wyeomyia smithii]|uniref:carbonic anhydrase 7 n=1 Tax=Wyeomyia smithii TaxID=174621 RepID=UPI002468215C|nr:carbonic anhydrase 7 [Wyeomyia smithii]